jgi:hypothetical protein
VYFSPSCGFCGLLLLLPLLLCVEVEVGLFRAKRSQVVSKATKAILAAGGGNTDISKKKTPQGENTACKYNKQN